MLDTHFVLQCVVNIVVFSVSTYHMNGIDIWACYVHGGITSLEGINQARYHSLWLLFCYLVKQHKEIVVVFSSNPIHCRCTSPWAGWLYFQSLVWERTLSDPILICPQLIYWEIDRAVSAEWSQDAVVQRLVELWEMSSLGWTMHR